MADFSKKVGKRIKRRREKIGMSQTDLADKIRVSQSAVNQFEKGLKKPSAPLLHRIALALEVTTDYFFGSAADDEIFVDEEVATVFRDYKELSEKDRKTIAELINVLKGGSGGKTK